ncbi:unnamed protein product [Thelazia callipaeda]|uniref:ABC transmembrane type-1 domain-containing protein n=1 Tax=Thelazia callipaeda TaxID=103827 RepID=A0A0N5D3Y6_THECL|nr:unnamed protein product [Thelazia callipaeda]
MDMKERVEKLSDMCNDINNQADNMIATLNAYNDGKSGIFYIVAAYSVDFGFNILRSIFAAITSIIPVKFELSPQAITNFSHQLPKFWYLMETFILLLLFLLC